MIIVGLAHIVFSAFLALLLGWLFGGLSGWLALLCLSAGFGLAWWSRRFFQTSTGPVLELGLGRLNPIEWVLVVLLVFIGLRHFAWLLYPVDATFRTLSTNNLGDLPLHINYIRQFAFGADMPPVNPEFAAEPLYYPYALDLYNGLWEAVGLPLSSHLFLVGIFLLVASLAALRSWAGWLGIVGFFLNGGWAGWQILQTGLWQDYQGPLAWKNFLLALFVTQRGIMFAIPAGLTVLSILYKACRDPAAVPRNLLLATGVLWGGLAFFHLHSFVAVSLMVAGYAALYRQFQPLLTALISAVPLGGGFVLYSTELLRKAGVMRLQWGWTAGEQPLLAYWWQNLGPWLLLFGATILLLVWRRRWLQLAEFGFYALLFLLFTWIMLAPWDWDNVKVLIWPYLGMLAIAWRCLPPLSVSEPAAPRSRLQHWGLLLSSGMMALVLGFSGLVSVLSSLTPEQDSVEVYQTRELWNMEGATLGLSPDAVFIAAPTYNHGLTWLGRIRVLGYEGHTWSHGIDSGEVAAKQQRIFSGDADWRVLATEQGATHIVWGPQEQLLYGTQVMPWRAQLANVSSVPGVEIYALD
ncbi:MAG: hypothetical protein RLZZ385_1851 [Pseudomonadota bacterium]|jgi:hypothetical protein